MRTLKDLFLNELAGICDAEHRLAKAMPKLAESATCEDLQATLQRHLGETQGQAGKLERIFGAFDERPRAKKCHAMAGLIEEANEIMVENENSATINAAIIAAVQRIKHYEIASYGCLHAWAIQLGNPDATHFLKMIMEEEKAADHALTRLAEAKNLEAHEEGESGAFNRIGDAGGKAHVGVSRFPQGQE